MSKAEVTRRAALGAFGALGIAPTIVLHGALAQPRAAFGGIHVDVAPLRANAGDLTATWVARVLPGALAQAFASSGRSGVPVAARIDYVILGPGSGGQGPIGSSPDQIVGEVIVGGVAHPLRATNSYYPMAVDQVLVEQSNFDRVSQLVQAFAYWAARDA
jgi:hypothetical protein